MFEHREAVGVGGGQQLAMAGWPTGAEADDNRAMERLASTDRIARAAIDGDQRAMAREYLMGDAPKTGGRHG